MEIGVLKKAFTIFEKQNWTKVQNNPEKEANYINKASQNLEKEKANLTKEAKSQKKNPRSRRNHSICPEVDKMKFFRGMRLMVMV